MSEVITYLGFGSPAFALSTVIRLVLATFCGIIIGAERENDRHPAGVRTHALVCLGSALVMLVSEFMFSSSGAGDPARMGAQVISGIGFLGAGTIIKEGYSVRGLTTAATLWAVSCVGLAIGSGFYLGGLIATLLMYVTLKLVKTIMSRHSNFATFTISADKCREILDEVVLAIEGTGWQVESTGVISYQDAPNLEINVYCYNDRKAADILPAVELIKKIQGVTGVTGNKGAP